MMKRVRVFDMDMVIAGFKATVWEFPGYPLNSEAKYMVCAHRRIELGVWDEPVGYFEKLSDVMNFINEQIKIWENNEES